MKQVRACAKAYEALAEAFSQLNNLPKLKAQINAGKDTWDEVSRPTPHETCVSRFKPRSAYTTRRTVTLVW